jgi:hypothetical protein
VRWEGRRIRDGIGDVWRRWDERGKDMVVDIDGGSRREGDVRDDPQRERTVGRADGGNELSQKTILDV